MTEKCTVHLYSGAKIEVLDSDEILAVFICVNCKSVYLESLGFIPKPLEWTRFPENARPAKPEIPEDENIMAECRCVMLNALDEYCDFGKPSVTDQNVVARKLYDQVMDRQTLFENEYC